MIKIENLSFSFGKNVNILHNLSLNVPEGSIYGFIGSNGAGKSTTIRCILGLLEPQHGTIKVLDKLITKDRNEILRQVGYLIEGPKFYANLSCLENLKLLKSYYSIDNNNIQDALERVGLYDSKNKLFGACSTGMKQRLGIAKSFLHNPRLLILDEPLNGLDPEWIAETRNIISGLNKDFGTTIFLSSHILSEMERVATHIGILRNGVLEFEGPIDRLLTTSDQKLIIAIDKSTHIDIQVFPAEFNVKKYNEYTFEFTVSDTNSINTILQLLLQYNVIIVDIKTNKLGLEDTYMNK